jgi:hypothetical protein
MSSNLCQTLGKLVGRQDEIDAAAGNGTLRHPRVRGRPFVLGERDPTEGFDFA